MTVHRNRFLVNKTNRCTDLQFYWYYDSTCFDSLSVHHQEFLAVHWLWYILCSFDDGCYQEQDGRCHPAPGSKRASQLHKMYQSQCTEKDSWWWAERLPEIFRVVIPIKLEFSASVGFIHKESYPWTCRYIQGVSRLVDITAGGDFLGLCDQKSSYKHVSDFGRLRSYGHFLVPVHAVV